jgi:hypothetical protein
MILDFLCQPHYNGKIPICSLRITGIDWLLIVCNLMIEAWG